MLSNIKYQISSKVEEHNEYNVDTFLTNVTSIHQPIHSKTTRVNNTNQKRNFIPKEDWLRIPEDIRARLDNNKSRNCSANNQRTVQNVQTKEHHIIDIDAFT
jgi:hypothetical protein